MGCTASVSYKKKGEQFSGFQSSRVNKVPLSEETKDILKESWKLVEPVKIAAGKKILTRLFQTNPGVQETFPAFNGVKLEDLLNSRSLYLHSKRVMTAVENAIAALNDAEVFVDYLMNLGERHLPWSVTTQHFNLLEEALLWTLQDMLQSKCTKEIVKAWSELFAFITTTMMAGMKRAMNT